VAGIIVPSSILNKSNKVYSKTREIILKNFHIVAIYESGS
jgi:type I restriction-modification system DNA methylase subunit